MEYLKDITIECLIRQIIKKESSHNVRFVMTTRNDTSSDNGFSGSRRTYSKLLHYGFSETSFGFFY